MSAAAAPSPSTAREELRRSAIQSARRHSARVRWLRVATVGGAVAVVAGIVLLTAFDPFGRVVHGVSVQGAAVEGTKVTMSAPKLSGYGKDGSPYEIEAERAVQDIKTPTVFELYALKARFTMEDHGSTRLTAATGIYSSSSETMTLGGGATVTGDTGLEVHAQDAVVTFKASTLTTDKPVSITMPGKRITADAMQITEGGKHVALDGHVHTEIDGADASAGGAGSP